ncbi:MAG: glycoside hydrolase family 32 protein [Janthinobacterium lividum]
MSLILGSMSRRAMLQRLAAAGLTSALPGRILAEFPSRARIESDALRPRYHLMPKRGWMNDPCAPVYFRGRYHLFFQYNPGASIWGDMHWAHAVSEDMVHWSARPVALAPTPGGPDSFGVFTGSMVLDGSTPTILYTCVSPSSPAESTLWGSSPPEREQQCLATPTQPSAKQADAALDVWNKLPRPVLTAPPPGVKVTGFRDPVPWQEADGSYYMLLASGQKGIGGNVLLYKSADLRAWTFQHIFAEGKWTGEDKADTVDSGEMWECPDFFPLGGKHVLIHSTGTRSGRRTVWQSGTLNKATMRWIPEREGLLNHGPYYAPKTQTDAAGNRILWGWIEETRPQAEFAKAGWAGCMSLPRVLTLRDGEVRFSPAQQIARLRDRSVAKADPVECEIVLHVTRQASAGTVLYNSAVLHVDGSSADETIRWAGEAVSRMNDLPDSWTIRCFVDHSVVEVFLGDFTVLTQRVYGDAPAHLQLPSGYRLVRSETYSLQA